MAEHSSLSVTEVRSSSFFLLLRVSFKYLMYLGICRRASTKGILTCSSLKMLRNCPYCFLTLFYIRVWGYGILGLYSFTGSSANNLPFSFCSLFSSCLVGVLGSLDFMVSSPFGSGGISCSFKFFVSSFIDVIGVSFILLRKIAFTCPLGLGSVLLGRVP